jgi:hypothetical protein
MKAPWSKRSKFKNSMNYPGVEMLICRIIGMNHDCANKFYFKKVRPDGLCDPNPGIQILTCSINGTNHD